MERRCRSYKSSKELERLSFEVLDELNEEGYIDGSKHAKSVYLTEEGLSKVKELMKKYIGKEE